MSLTKDTNIGYAYTYTYVNKNLAMGGAVPQTHPVFDEFDIVVFCAGEWQPSLTLPENDKSKRVIRVPFDDTPEALTASVRAQVHKTVNEIAEEHRSGRNILVTCMAGRNRSGLVTALALRDLFSLSSEEAIALIKKTRGPFALTNRSFTSYLLSLK